MFQYNFFFTPRISIFLFFGLGLSFTAAFTSLQTFAKEPDPRAYFFMSGLTIGNREFQLGDPENWNIALNNLSGESVTGKIQAQPEDYQGKNDALQLVWSKEAEINGRLTLQGPAVDLSAFQNIAALTMDIKITRKPTSEVTMGMDCGPSCRAEVRVDKRLKKEKLNKWTVFSIPLNCFKSDSFDPGKINRPLLISTSGGLELSVANVRLVRLPPGETGCEE